jgi:hypothetical protein
VAGPHLDEDLFGAWNMKPVNGVLVDQTVQGNDGAPGQASAVEDTILGLMRRYLPNSGSAASTLGAANAFALNDVTIAFWMRVDLAATAIAWIVNYFFNVADGWGVRINNGTAIQLYDDIDNANAILYTTAVPRGKIVHVVAVLDSLENLLYVDNVLAGSGTPALDDWSSFTGTLYHGERGNASGAVEGIVGPLHVFDEAKDQAWVTQEYLKGARAIQFKTDWGVRESVGNETTNMRVGVNSSPFEINSGTYQMSLDVIDGVPVKVIECIGAGEIVCPTSLFEATPTEAAFGTWDFWLSHANASTTICNIISAVNTGAPAPGYHIRVTNAEVLELRENGVGVIITAGTAFGVDTFERIRLTRRYDGRFDLYLNGVNQGNATDLTGMLSNFMVFDLDAGDKLAYSDQRGDHSFVKYLGVIAP